MSFNSNTNYAENYQSNLSKRYTVKSFTKGLAKAKYNWAGAKTVAIYSHTSPDFVDYNRSAMKGSGGVESRYGDIHDVDMVTQKIEIKEDKAVSITVDALDMATTAGALKANEVLKSFTDEKAIPYFDKYCIKTWFGFAGDTIVVANLGPSTGDKENTATFALQDASEKFFNNNIVDGEKVCLCTPEFFKHLKRSDYFVNTLQQNVVYKGEVGELDGWKIVVVPKNYMPTNVWALCVDPRALVCEEKLNEYKVITNSERVSGALINVRQSFVAGADYRKATGIIAIVASDTRPSTAQVYTNFAYSTSATDSTGITAGQLIAAGENVGSAASFGVYLDTSDTGYVHGRWSALVAVTT